MNIKIGVSARHVHLTAEDVKILFGENYELNKIKKLSQDNNFSCMETVDLKNGKNVIRNVRVIGPVRDNTQVEVSKTDLYNLKTDAPYRNSGNLDDASSITICGPQGSVERKALIIATRHIHMNTKEADELGYKHNDIVNIKIGGEKGGILDNVYIRISDNYTLELHLDLDDANSHNVKNGDMAFLINNKKII